MATTFLHFYGMLFLSEEVFVHIMQYAIAGGLFPFVANWFQRYDQHPVKLGKWLVIAMGGSLRGR